jgi:hypothetical protein
VLLSSTGGEGSNSNAPNTGSGYSSAANAYPEQSLNDKVETFETLNETAPSGEELRKECNDDPHKIFDKSKDLLKGVDADKNELLGQIASEKEANKISEARAFSFVDRVNEAADIHRVEIKETNNTAVEYIDDSSDTEDCLFKNVDQPWDTEEETSDTED